MVALPAGADPADLAQRDPERLRQAVAEAKPFLGFRLERLFATADLRNPEGRARAAEAGLALISEHPDSLVRDQYLMQVSDRCHLSPEQLRALPPRAPSRNGERPDRAVVPAAPKPKAPALPRPELEALRLAVHHPDESCGPSRYRPFQFRSWPRPSTPNLASAMTLHEAIESAAPEVADLLGQLAVEDTQEDPDDVLGQLVDQAAARALAELRREARSSTPERQPQRTGGTLCEPAPRPRSHALRRPRPGLRSALGWRGASLASFVAGKS